MAPSTPATVAPASPILSQDDLVREALPVVHQVLAGLLPRLPRSVDRDDLTSAAMLGLVQAARSFDPRRNVAFTAYARSRVRGAVLDELRGRDWVSRRVRRDAKRVEAMAADLGASLGRVATAGEVANRLGCDEERVQRVRAAVESAATLHQSTRSRDEADGDALERVPAPEAGPETRVLEIELRGYVADAVAALPERLRRVVTGYYLDGQPMQELARELGVTESRVSQLCSEAISLLRDGINAGLAPELVPDLDGPGRAARRRSGYCAAVTSASTPRARLERRLPRAA